MEVSQRTLRRLRRTLIGVSMLCAVLVLVVAAVLLYWRLYLLEPSGDPFTRGPYLVGCPSTARGCGGSSIATGRLSCGRSRTEAMRPSPPVACSPVCRPEPATPGRPAWTAVPVLPAAS